MTLIKTDDSAEFGKSRITGFGEIAFDQNGVADVSEDAAQTLTKISPSLSIVPDALEPVTPVMPVTPVIEPVTPVIEPVTPVIEPVTPVIEPVTPVIEPVTPVELIEPIIPVIEPVIEDKVTENVIQQTVIEEASENTTEEGQEGAQVSELIAIREQLEGKNMAELREFCVKLEIPESEYEGFKGKEAKEPFINFIVGKATV